MKGKSRRAHEATSITAEGSLTKTPSKRIEVGEVSGPAVGKSAGYQREREREQRERAENY